MKHQCEIDAEVVRRHISFLAKRPGMYVGDESFHSVARHLEGYFFGLMTLTDTRMFSSWRYWLAMKFNKWSPRWSWSRMIRNSVSSDKEAIELLPGLFKEFLEHYLGTSDDGIEEEHRKHFSQGDT